MKLGYGTTSYPESGLDNVVLQNVPIWRCPNAHEDVQIPAVDQLNTVLAQLIVTQPWPLKGREIRFVRKYLGYSGRAFSQVMGINHVTLSKFENDRNKIPRKLEALVRLVAAQSMAERGKNPFPKPLMRVLEQLEASGSLGLGDLTLEHVDFGDSVAEPRHVWREAMAGV